MKFIAINKTNQCKLLTWAEMMLPKKNAPPETLGVLIYCKYARKLLQYTSMQTS